MEKNSQDEQSRSAAISFDIFGWIILVKSGILEAGDVVGD